MVEKIWLRKEIPYHREAYESQPIDDDCIQVLNPPCPTTTASLTPSTATTPTPPTTPTPTPARPSRSRSPHKKATNTNHIADPDSSSILDHTPSLRPRYI